MEEPLRVSIARFVYLGSHPILTLIAIVINLYVVALLVAWAAVVTVVWLLCCAVAVPWRALRRRAAPS